MDFKPAIEYVYGLGEGQITNFTTDSGDEFVNRGFSRILPDYAEPLKTNTLTSIVDYIRENPDSPEFAIIHVVSHDEVLIESPLDGFMKRNIYVRAKANIPEVMNYGYFYDGETFNIALLSRFVHTKDIDGLTKIAGNITETAVKTSVDDGISQSVTTKTGITTVATTKIPARVSLKPFRTFTEIPQPESDFVFRVREGAEMALFEADGGAWKNQAILEIKKYLEEQIKEYMPGIVILA